MGGGAIFKSRNIGLAVPLPESQASSHLSNSLPRIQLSVLLAPRQTLGDTGQAIHLLPDFPHLQYEGWISGPYGSF